MTLISTLSPLSHAERTRVVIEWGRCAPTSPPHAQAIETLARGDAYQRRLALMSAHGSRDGNRVLTALSDPSHMVYRRAICLVAVLCDDDAAAQALEITWSRRDHTHLLRRLLTRQRRAVVDRFLAQRLHHGEPIDDLFPLASTDFHNTHLHTVVERTGPLFWSRLLRHAPATAGHALHQRLLACEAWPEPSLRPLLHLCRSPLTQRAPDAALPCALSLSELGAREGDAWLLDLLRAGHRPTLEHLLDHRADITLPYGCLQELTPQLEPELLRRVIARDAHALGYLVWLWDALHDAQHDAILDAWRTHYDSRYASWGFQLIPLYPAEHQRPLFEQWWRDVTAARHAPSAGELDRLPLELARDAAERILQSSLWATQPEVRLTYARFLTYALGAPLLQPYIQHPRGEVRGPALQALIRLAGREHIEDALELVAARPREQDPVRVYMLTGLNTIPPRHLREAHLPILARILRAALDASDCSRATLHQLELLLAHLFRFHGAWTLPFLEALLEERHHSGWPQTAITYDITSEQVEAQHQPFLDLIAIWARRAPHLLAPLLHGLDDHLHHLHPEWRSPIEQLLRDNPSPHLAVQLLPLLHANAPERFYALFEALAPAWLEIEAWRAPLANLLLTLEGVQLSSSLLETFANACLTAPSGPAAQAFMHLAFALQSPVFTDHIEAFTTALHAHDTQPRRSYYARHTLTPWIAQLLDLARTRGLEVPQLLFAQVEALARTATLDAAHRLLSFLHQHRPERFRALVPRLLDHDPTAVIVPCVLRYVSHRRPELLASVLGQRSLQGRFGDDVRLWLHLRPRGFHRWHAPLQRALARTLDATIADEEESIFTRQNAIRVRSRLQLANPQPLLTLVEHSRPPIQETALRAIAHLDGGEGLEVLVACLADERGKVAIYALRRALARLSVERAAALLKDAPLTYVTVGKELVRLLGDLGGATGRALLYSLAERDLHRDVHIALIRALHAHLEHEPTWTILAAAVDAPAWVVPEKLAELPTHTLSRTSDTRLCQLLARVIARPEIEARIALMRRAVHLPLSDAQRSLLDACLERLTSPHVEELTAAALAITARARKRDAQRVAQALQAALDNRRMVHVFCQTLHAALSSDPHPGIRPLATTTLAVLTSDPLLTPLALRLAARIERRDVFKRRLEGLERAGRLHADSMSAALDAMHSLALRLQARSMSTLIQQLSEHTSPRFRRLAVAGIVELSQQKGWNTRRRQGLNRLQSDPELLVAGAAQAIFPPLLPGA